MVTPFPKHLYTRITKNGSMEENDYSEDVSVLLEGVQTGRLRVEKLTKKQMATANKEKYTIVIVDTAIPGRRKKTKNISKKENTEKPTKTEQPLTKPAPTKTSSSPIKPEPPAMCEIQKIS